MKYILMAILFTFAQPAELSDTLTVTQQGETIVTVNREDFTTPVPGMPMIDFDKYQQFIRTLEQKIYKAPENAKLNDQGEIVPGQVGYRLYRKKFHEQFYSYFFGQGSSTIEVPELDIYPKVDSELLSHLRVQRIGQYVTYFNSNNKNRSHNISLAAEAIDNHVVFPNETFSFNKVVGKRTKEEGYMPAPIIVRGETLEGVGGGICQVSSTLHNAVDRVGLTIVERYSHSKRVPYVPPGRDATVSWYGPDFRFYNNYNQPILIRANKHGGSLVIKLYSSDMINNETRKVPKAPSSTRKNN